ncbi:hypothetical protein PPERSA_01080 [Pseudocohnilembus persalinus]|uniref:NAD(P)-binding domain n=1 Tax=Pseudocohnilembus persalinus TaxID=266149 RepID=A0A0V0QUP7_PSEPJ|nr:hypothetical protein PPERSA_01080 [Pseudocohnilembus persalinus]|eukprot:KRX06002.1 hypothetical protein PPERSA_01080 [Pseudocohnilembus persalinus]
MKIDQNTVALVTGGASGLGEQTVRQLVQLGAKVMIADLNEENGNNMAKELGNQVKFFKTNVTDEENVKNLVEETVKAFGAIHIVVNSAGIISAGKFLNKKGRQIEVKDFMKCIQINVVGTFLVSKYASAQMAKQEYINEQQERGVIIMVASVAAFEGQQGQTTYSASKGALVGMTLPMARDLGVFGIRVVTIAPGLFMTPMGSSLPEKAKVALEKSTALGRLGIPEEFAQMAVSIAQNSYLTGVTIRIDGGIRFPNM